MNASVTAPGSGIQNRRTILLLGLAAFGVAFGLACFQIIDFDTWFHLAFGREVLARGGVPRFEPFTLAGQGLPVRHTEWLFGTIIYLVYRIAGLGGVIFFKALIAGLTFFVLHRDAQGRGLSPALTFVVVWLGAITAQTRFYERPEIFMLLFVALDSLLLDRFFREGAPSQAARGWRRLWRSVFWIPIVEVLWANTHASAVTGPLLVGAWLGGGLLLGGLARLLGARPSWALDWRRAATLGGVLLATIAAMLCTPWGVEPVRDAVGLLLPLLGAAAPAGGSLEVANLLKHQIAELQPFHITTLAEPYVIVLLLAALALPVSVVSRALRAGSGIEGARPSMRARLAASLDPDLVRFGLGAGAVAMTFNAVRFHALATILLLPAIARGLMEGLAPLLETALGAARRWRSTVATRGVLVGWVLLLGGLAAATVHSANTTPRAAKMGFGVSTDRFPEGAIRYMLARGVKGPLLNTFHFGGYLEWRAFPRLRPLLDGRGVSDAKLFENILSHNFLALEKSHGIQSALLEFSALTPEQGEAVSQGVNVFGFPADWKLVYWDDVSFVLVREGGRNAAIARADAVKALDPWKDYYSWFSTRFLDPALRHQIAADADRMRALAPDDFKPALLAAKLALVDGKLDKATTLARAARTRIRPWLRQAREYQLGADLVLAEVAERRGRTHEAIHFLEEVISINPSRKSVLYRLGFLHENAGRIDQAIEYYRRALAFNPALADGSQRLAKLLRARGDDAGALAVEEAARQAQHRLSGEASFYEGTRLYQQGNLAKAVEAFRASLAQHPNSAATLSNLGYALFDMGLYDQALGYQLRAIEADPGFANAHYGLALIHRKKGNTEQMRYHLRRYLALIPRGPFARNAETMLHQTTN